MGPTFPTIPTFLYFFFLCSYFSLLFSENALLSLLFSPKMFEVTKNCNFFPRSLCSLGVSKNQINLNWAATMQKFKNYFYFSCNSFFGTFILVFLFHGNVVLLFREKFVSLYLSLSLKTLRTSLPSLLFMIEIPSFALLFQNFEPDFIPTFLTEGTWKPDRDVCISNTYICISNTEIFIYRNYR